MQDHRHAMPVSTDTGINDHASMNVSAIAHRRRMFISHSFTRKIGAPHFLPFLCGRMMARIGRKIAIMRSHNDIISTEGSLT